MYTHTPPHLLNTLCGQKQEGICVCFTGHPSLSLSLSLGQYLSLSLFLSLSRSVPLSLSLSLGQYPWLPLVFLVRTDSLANESGRLQSLPKLSSGPKITQAMP